MNQLLQEGRYRLEKQLSHDDHGTVYEAVDNKMNRSVLIKEIPVRLGKVATASQQESIRLAFVTEARRLATINHESLLKVYDNFSEIGRQYLVLENVDGMDLEDLTKTNGVPFGYAEAAGWADQILDGLIYIHNMKPPVIHRAIKPKNIKLLAGGHVKLLAYSMTDANSQLDTSSDADSTQSPSLHFAPIEQIWESLDPASQKVITNSYDEKSEALLKQPADARSDIFGMAATLYYLLTARSPIDALERSIYMLEGKDDPLAPPHEANPDVPPEVSNVVMRGLEIKREDRFESASMMRQVLKTSLVLIEERKAEEAKQAAAAPVSAVVPELETFAKPEPAPAVAFNGNGIADVAPAISTIGNIPPLHLAAEPLNATASGITAEDDSEIVRQLREAEAKRKLAEERAAEAERLLRERDMALSPLTTPEKKERPEPDAYVPRPDEVAAREEALNAAPPEPAPEIEPDEYVPAFTEPEPEKDIFAAAKKPEPVEAAPAVNAASDVLLPELGVSYADANPLEELAAPISLEHVIDEEPAKEDIFANAFAPEPEYDEQQMIHDSTSFAPSFGSSEKRGSSFGLPMIAGAAAVLLVAVALGWYFISSGSSAPVENVPPPVASQPENAVPEQQPQVQPETETVLSAEPETPADQPAATVTLEPEPQQQASQPTRTDTRQQPARPARTRAAQTDAAVSQPIELPPAPKKQTAKKKLTVDDLLKDN